MNLYLRAAYDQFNYIATWSSIFGGVIEKNRQDAKSISLVWRTATSSKSIDVTEVHTTDGHLRLEVTIHAWIDDLDMEIRLWHTQLVCHAEILNPEFYNREAARIMCEGITTAHKILKGWTRVDLIHVQPIPESTLQFLRNQTTT